MIMNHENQTKVMIRSGITLQLTGKLKILKIKSPCGYIKCKILNETTAELQHSILPDAKLGAIRAIRVGSLNFFENYSVFLPGLSPMKCHNRNIYALPDSQEPFLKTDHLKSHHLWLNPNLKKCEIWPNKSWFGFLVGCSWGLFNSFFLGPKLLNFCLAFRIAQLWKGKVKIEDIDLKNKNLVKTQAFKDAPRSSSHNAVGV